MWDNLFDKLVPLSYTRIGYQLRQRGWDDTHASMEGRTCVITGANAGLGRATAETLAKHGATVHLLCRNKERGEEAKAAISQSAGHTRVHLHQVDMSQQTSVRHVAKHFLAQSEPIDVLINNAGVLLDQRQENDEGLEMTFATNTLGYLLLTELLKPALLSSKDPRVLNITSGGMYTTKFVPDDLQYKRRAFDGVAAYAESKRVAVVMTRHWAHDPSWRGIFFAAIHPGWADTGGVQRSLPRFWKVTRSVLRTPEQGADTMIWLAARSTVQHEKNGALWFDRSVHPKHQLPNTRNTPAEEEAVLHHCRTLVGLVTP